MKYKLVNRTLEEMQCGISFCPGIYESKGNYIIIGIKVNPVDFGLEKKSPSQLIH